MNEVVICQSEQIAVNCLPHSISDWQRDSQPFRTDTYKRRMGPTEVSYYLGSRGDGGPLSGVNDMSVLFPCPSASAQANTGISTSVRHDPSRTLTTAHNSRSSRLLCPAVAHDQRATDEYLARAHPATRLARRDGRVQFARGHALLVSRPSPSLPDTDRDSYDPLSSDSQRRQRAAALLDLRTDISGDGTSHDLALRRPF